jgi:hypothetical protein
MRPLVSLVLLVFWLAMAYRAWQRNDMLFAGVFLLVGIVLTTYRLRSAAAASSRSAADPGKP